MGFLLRNWHLKLSAVLLATVLYTGLVFSGWFATRTLQIRIDLVNQPANSYVLTSDLGFIQVEFRAPRDVIGAVVEEAFVARVDLADYDMGAAPEPQFLEIDVRALNDDIEVISEQQTVRVELDRIDQRAVPVTVDIGDVPEGLEAGTPETSEDEVLVRGPASVVARVDRAVAVVNLDASGISFDRAVELVLVDIEGQPIGEGLVDASPQSVSVRVELEAVEETRPVPVRPAITGTPAAGFALEALRVEPSTVILLGRPEALEAIRVIVTEPLSIEGASSDQTFDAVLVLPDGVSYESGAPPEVTVTATIGPSVSSRTFIVGVICDGAGDNACLPGLDQIAVTLSGPGEALSSLTAAALTPVLDVGGLTPGSYQITPALPGLPDGVSVLDVEPGTVPVTIVAPAATPGPTPTPVP
jgi:YbbR domain-containing protein